MNQPSPIANKHSNVPKTNGMTYTPIGDDMKRRMQASFLYLSKPPTMEECEDKEVIPSLNLITSNIKNALMTLKRKKSPVLLSKKYIKRKLKVTRNNSPPPSQIQNCYDSVLSKMMA